MLRFHRPNRIENSSPGTRRTAKRCPYRDVLFFQHGSNLLHLIFTELGFPAALAPTLAPQLNPQGSFPDQIALQLGHRRKHLEDQLARCKACVAPLRQLLESDAAHFQNVHDHHQVGQRPAQLVQVLYGQCVASSECPQVVCPLWPGLRGLA